MDAKHTPLWVAGLFSPDEGDIRVKLGTVTYWLPNDPRADENGNVDVRGFMVQEYGPRISEDGFELTGEGQWGDLCPLVDLPALYPRLVAQLPNLRYDAKATAK